MSHSKEYLSIVKCASQLACALHSNRDIPHYLHAELFLTKDIYDDVINPKSRLSDSDKAIELVNGIRRRVEQSPTDFHKFMDHLRKQGSRYGDIVKLLDERYLAAKEVS